jgi:ABC-2 type transport system permease protein
MKQLTKLALVESKLLWREPATWIIAVLLPTAILVILGLVFSPNEPLEALGDNRFIDLFAPSLVVITLAALGANTLPTRLISYREKGILRRLSTTPIHPASLLVAQLAINMIVAVVAVGLLVAVGHYAFQIPLPRQPLSFVAAVVFGMSSLFALGLLVAAVATTARAGAALVSVLFIAVMFLGGVWVPRFVLPEFLVRIGDYTPPGVQALMDAWMGTAPHPLQLAVMAVITAVAGVAAARMFRWE